ncbi:MAG: SDR family NAD(P)-dependent oxidoreductase [Clostridia bacterium]|nr:SDR family NAD(P)-dependent oxidoreductase [Clostridia bacterium]
MRIAVVTGASSGMGRDFVRQISEGFELEEIWAVARREELLRQLAQEVRTPLRVIAADLTEPESFERYAALLREHEPDIRILVNGSGFGKFGHCERIDPDAELNMIDLNCKALVRMTRLSLPYMHSGGHIIQLDSMSAFQPTPYMNVYASSKAFVYSYALGMGEELRRRGIHVMAMCPGWIRTDFFGRAVDEEDKAISYYNRLYESEDVVRTALRDMRRGRRVSLHGAGTKLQRLGVKLLPASWVMNIWMRQQRGK